MSDSKLHQVIEVVAKALEVPTDDLGPESSMDNTPCGSVGHLTICLEFGDGSAGRWTSTDFHDVERARSAGSFCDLIAHADPRLVT